jgi:hypothetical protein
MTDEELKLLGTKLVNYCDKYFIPILYIFEILNDQKVTPMTRGKAMEFSAFLKIRSLLNESEWSVEKLNLSAQLGAPDEDISVTHRRSGIILKVESKSAVRESFRSGRRTRIINVPHFRVKCHRSRSNIRLSQTSNDRYPADEFDIIITSPLNAIFEGNTVGENLELIHDNECVSILNEHYGVSTEEDLLKAAHNDWRFVLPPTIAQRGFIPRTPFVLLNNDLNWLPIEQVEAKLLDVVNIRRARGARSRR